MGQTGSGGWGGGGREEEDVWESSQAPALAPPPPPAPALKKQQKRNPGLCYIEEVLRTEIEDGECFVSRNRVGPVGGARQYRITVEVADVAHLHKFHCLVAPFADDIPIDVVSSASLASVYARERALRKDLKRTLAFLDGGDGVAGTSAGTAGTDGVSVHHEVERGKGSAGGWSRFIL